MLSPSEEKQRALKVSELYGRPLNRRISKETPAFKMGDVVISSVVLSTPFITFAILFDLYENSSYSYVADIQGASFIFIIGLFEVVLFGIPLIRYARARLDNSYVFSNSLFWIILFIIVGYCFSMFQLITGSSSQAFLEVSIRLTVFVLSTFTVSVLSTVILAKFFYKLSKG